MAGNYYISNMDIMTTSQTLRKCISTSNNELVIYASDNFAQFPAETNPYWQDVIEPLPLPARTTSLSCAAP